MRINGKEVAWEPITLLEYLRREGYNPARVVAERNMEVITGERFREITLAEEDDINILHFMGGG